jgi:hypothetical protein
VGDLKDPRLMYLKAVLFLVAGLLAAGGLVAQSPTLTTLLLLGICVWSFCRLYYFIFYVIEHYIDAQYRFAGLGAFVVYLVRRRIAPRAPERDNEAQSEQGVP